MLCQILRLGRPEDYVAAVKVWGAAPLRRPLLDARPGGIDRKPARF